MDMNPHVKYLKLLREQRIARNKILARIETACWLIAIALILLLLCSGCSALKPSWQGLYLGTELVSPFNHPNSSPDAEATAIIGLDPKSAIEFGVWGNRDAQGFRVAIERRIF